MKQKSVLIITFILLFSVIFNMDSGGVVTVNAASGGPKLERSNIEDGERDVYADKTFVLIFDRNIKRGPGKIELYNWDRSKREKVEFDIYGDTLEITLSSRMEFSSDYELTLEKNSIVTDDKYKNPMAKRISISFITKKDPKDWDEDDNLESIGKTYGIRFGEIEGQLYGYMDSLKDRKNNWNRVFPTNREIIREYNLGKETADYRNAFLKDFKEGFKRAYEEAFRDENFRSKLVTKEDGLSHGRTIGMLAGEVQGKLDYINGRNNNWELSMLRELGIPWVPGISSNEVDRLIKEKYDLNRESSEYRESFLTEYKDGFREAYNFAFHDENLKVSAGSLDTTYISMSGGEVNSYDGAVKLKIEPGSFYEETGISIGRTILYAGFSGSGITPATDSYSIKMQNLLNSVNLKKPITIEFEYYGPKEGAIHELKNGRWSYLYSRIEDNKIYTDIYTNRYSGGTYAVLINEKYEAVDDIGGHWAVQPIETFLRRNYINGYSDKTFRPNQSITRAEFVKILDNVYNWGGNPPHVGGNFADSSVFGVFTDSISKAVSRKLIKGYEDNTFRPHIPITYQEVEWLMQRVTGRYNFKWDIVAENILKDYYVYSKSYNSKQNYITRAEVVYMLYLLEEGLI